MRIGALGTLVWDRIWHPSRPAGAGPTEQWGGMTYSLLALRAALPAGWSVEPWIKVGADRADAARPLLRRLGLPEPGEAGPVRIVAERNNQVDLHYRDEAGREEHLRGGVPRWRFDELDPLLDSVDAIYLNFLAGNEIDLETAERLRARFHGRIHADLHSLFLGPAGTGARAPVPLREPERWLRCFDVVQLNEEEAALLAPGAKPWEITNRLGVRAPEVLVVTRGARGAVCGARTDLGATRWLRIPAEPVGGGDPTGCGDIWGSVFCVGLLEGRDPREAGARASRAAAARIRAGGVEQAADAIANALAAG